MLRESKRTMDGRPLDPPKVAIQAETSHDRGLQASVPVQDQVQCDIDQSGLLP